MKYSYYMGEIQDCRSPPPSITNDRSEREDLSSLLETSASE